MKKLLASAICILVLIGCRKEYRTPSAENQNPERNSQTPPKCGIDLDPDFTAKMMKARRYRDEQEKVNKRRPKDIPDPVSSPTVIFLDADGHTVENTVWNWSGPLKCHGAGLTSDQINEIIKSVREDFSTFEVTVTSDENLYNEAAKGKRVRVIMTTHQGLENFFPNFGGYAFIGSLWWNDDTPCFVFAESFFGNTANLAEAVSHEAGHTIGLFHQSEYDDNGMLKYEYHTGIFLMPWSILWKPIMGTSYYPNISGWMNGRTTFGTQNDTELLSRMGVNADEVPDILSTGKELKLNGREKQVTVNELINKQADADYYSIQNKEIKFSVTGRGNADMKITVYNNQKKVIAEFNDQHSISISEKTVKSKGNKIFLKVEANDLLPGQIQSAGQYTLYVKKI